MLRASFLLVVVLFGVCLVGRGWSQETATAETPPAQPTPASKSPELIAELERTIEVVRGEWQVPGLAVGIVQDGTVLMSRGFGVRRLGESTPVDGNTLFAIASNSKAFTAAALAILVEDKKLTWDDHVYKHLPWFRLRDDAATRDLRVRDLLCHRSGLGTFSGDLLWWGTSYSPKEVLERAALLEPTSSLRSEYGYSNLMFLAAGLVVEATSGLSWCEFVEQRILSPLEMERTVCSVRDLIALENFATPHKTTLAGSSPIPWVNWDAMAAAGGIISSTNDMTKWLRLQLDGGRYADGKRMYSEELGWEMWQNHTPMRATKAASSRAPHTHFRGYGLGWALNDLHGYKMVGHGGGYDGMYSKVLMVPEKQLGIVVLTNSMTGIADYVCGMIAARLLGLPESASSQEARDRFIKSRERFEARMAGSVQPVVKGTNPSHPQEDYCGSFECPMYGAATVTAEDGKLILRLLPNPNLVAELEHLHYDTYAIKWHKDFAWFGPGTAHFVADAKGRFVAIELDVPNDDLWFYEIKLRRKP
jgi:CubicO group peptidase (beta-lactamase class C family)